MHALTRQSVRMLLQNKKCNCKQTGNRPTKLSTLKVHPTCLQRNMVQAAAVKRSVARHVDVAWAQNRSVKHAQNDRGRKRTVLDTPILPLQVATSM